MAAAVNKILVTGATGKIGSHLVSELTSGKFPNVEVTVFARDKAKGEKEFGNKVRIAVGDLNDVASFEAAVKGQTRLFLLSNNPLSEPALAKVALAAGVKHIVKLSCVDASLDAEPQSFLYAHGKSEFEIRGLGAPLTSLRPGDFMQNIFSYGGSIKQQGAFYTATQDAAIASIDARDIAESAAVILTDPIADWVNTAFFLTGPEAITRAELAQKVSEVIGKPVKNVNVDDVSFFKTMTSYNLPRALVLGMHQLNQHYRLRYSNQRFVNLNVELITGKKARTWKAFLEENKAFFV